MTKRILPRLTIRRLLIGILAIASILGSWLATRRAAEKLKTTPAVRNAVALCPFLLKVDEYVAENGEEWERNQRQLAKQENAALVIFGPRSYRLWFFGLQCRFPLASPYARRGMWNEQLPME
ncbi:MAG: hypothetical protein KDB14_01885 [Planctomycetales bacterium]|nr:hypothetical protein [Planctomycetales bacterium]